MSLQICHSQFILNYKYSFKLTLYANAEKKLSVCASFRKKLLIVATVKLCRRGHRMPASRVNVRLLSASAGQLQNLKLNAGTSLFLNVLTLKDVLICHLNR